MYRPLPDELTIKSSPIEGLGLFATKEIKANESFVLEIFLQIITYYKVKKFS